MRGKSLFVEIFEPSAKPSNQKKGRSADLHAKRNECLIHRFFYYGKFTSNRYEKIIKDLSNEFFLSTVTIPEVIDDNYQQLIKLKEQQPPKSYFVKKWPHLNW
jgi:hypothetical protein